MHECGFNQAQHFIKRPPCTESQRPSGREFSLAATSFRGRRRCAAQFARCGPSLSPVPAKSISGPSSDRHPGRRLACRSMMPPWYRGYEYPVAGDLSTEKRAMRTRLFWTYHGSALHTFKPRRRNKKLPRNGRGSYGHCTRKRSWSGYSGIATSAIHFG